MAAKKTAKVAEQVRRTITIAVANHKGGVGKTTTTLSIGALLASRGYNVLLVDLDAQSNLTLSLIKEDAEYESIYDAISKRQELPIVHVRENLDIVPSSLNLTQLELSMMGLIHRVISPLNSLSMTQLVPSSLASNTTLYPFPSLHDADPVMLITSASVAPLQRLRTKYASLPPSTENDVILSSNAFSRSLFAIGPF